MLSHFFAFHETDFKTRKTNRIFLFAFYQKTKKVQAPHITAIFRLPSILSPFFMKRRQDGSAEGTRRFERAFFCVPGVPEKPPTTPSDLWSAPPSDGGAFCIRIHASDQQELVRLPWHDQNFRKKFLFFSQKRKRPPLKILEISGKILMHRFGLDVCSKSAIQFHGSARAVLLFSRTCLFCGKIFRESAPAKKPIYISYF
ncbi:MAG: hypothetical protein J6J31_07595 [Thermoguttaceae bacterium]|nr:hypothetical protein [Thermoguttaceae bacterium]